MCDDVELPSADRRAKWRRLPAEGDYFAPRESDDGDGHGNGATGVK